MIANARRMDSDLRSIMQPTPEEKSSPDSAQAKDLEISQNGDLLTLSIGLNLLLYTCSSLLMRYFYCILYSLHFISRHDATSGLERAAPRSYPFGELGGQRG